MIKIDLFDHKIVELKVNIHTKDFKNIDFATNLYFILTEANIKFEVKNKIKDPNIFFIIKSVTPEYITRLLRSKMDPKTIDINTF